MLLEQHLQAAVKMIAVNLQESCSCNDTRARDHSGRSGDTRELLARISPFGGSMECKQLADAASSSPAGEPVGEMNPDFGPCCRWWCWHEVDCVPDCMQWAEMLKQEKTGDLGIFGIFTPPFASTFLKVADYIGLPETL